MADNQHLAKVFGKILKEERLKNNLTQEKLAFNCGLERTYISFLERGLRQPTLTTIFTIAEQLNLKPEELIRKVAEND